jgi:hypothetical protein
MTQGLEDEESPRYPLDEQHNAIGRVAPRPSPHILYFACGGWHLNFASILSLEGDAFWVAFFQLLNFYSCGYAVNHDKDLVVILGDAVPDATFNSVHYQDVRGWFHQDLHCFGISPQGILIERGSSGLPAVVQAIPFPQMLQTIV